MSINRVVGIVGFILIVCSPNTRAASSVSPNITGSWSGKATGADYKDQDNGTGGTTPVQTKAAGSVVVGITQTGNDLSMTLTITIPPSKSDSGGTFSIPYTGKVGSFAFWATGTRPAGADGQDSAAEPSFISGHFDAKPSKLMGNFVLYKDGHVTNVAYTLKKTSSTPMTRGNPAIAFLAGATGTPREDAPFNIAGSSIGKSFNLLGSDKALSFKSTITGAIDPTVPSATITIVSASGGTETFTSTEIDGGHGLVFTGTSGSDSLLMFGVGSKTGAAGIGWIYNDGGMIEFKFSVKKQ